MPERPASLTYDPNRLLDTLSAWLGAKSDRMLSRMLRLSLALIQRLRTGHLPVRVSILSSMAEAAGKSIEELRRVLGERRSKVRMSFDAKSTGPGAARRPDK